MITKIIKRTSHKGTLILKKGKVTEMGALNVANPGALKFGKGIVVAIFANCSIGIE